MEGDCFIVLDAFALPVEGTETRVNAQQEAYEYIIDFAETNKVRPELTRLRPSFQPSTLRILVPSKAKVERRCCRLAGGLAKSPGIWLQLFLRRHAAIWAL